MTVTPSELRQQWDECLRLLDRDRVRERQGQSTDYYNAQGRMVSLLWANAPALLDAYEREQSAQREEALWQGALRTHWLASIECDHEGKRDRPLCGCASLDLGWHPSVGVAVEAWILHVTAEVRDTILRAHPDYEEAQQDIGKKPQPGDLLSTDEEIKRLVHGDEALDITKMPGYRWGYEAGQKADATRTSLLAYGTHKPGCGGLTSTTGRACECGWIQVRDLAKEAKDA